MWEFIIFKRFFTNKDTDTKPRVECEEKRAEKLMKMFVNLNNHWWVLLRLLLWLLLPVLTLTSWEKAIVSSKLSEIQNVYNKEDGKMEQILQSISNKLYQQNYTFPCWMKKCWSDLKEHWVKKVRCRRICMVLHHVALI